MKKIKFISFILTLSTVFSLFSAAFAADSSSETIIFDSSSSLDSVETYDVNLLRGDMNRDTHLNVRDVNTIKQIISGKTEDYFRFAADIDESGKINAKDTVRLKKMIAGLSDPLYYGNTTVSKSFDSEENAMVLTETEVNETAAFFDIGLENRDQRYFAIVLKGSEGVSATVAYPSNLNDPALSYDSIDGNNYSAYIAELPVKSEYAVLEVSFDADPAMGRDVYVDSVVFSNTIAEVKALAQARVDARHIEEPTEFKYITVDFNNSAALSRISAANHTTASYNAGYSAMKLQVSGSSADPWVLIDLEDLSVPADEYKYIVYKSMIPSNCNQPTPEGELFYAVGNIMQPTAGYSNIYSQFKDSQFHSTIVEFTNAAFWTGTVHSLRFDYYCGCAVGDSQYVRSLTFCNSYEAAAAICEDRVTPVPDIKSLFFYGKYDDGDFMLSYRMYIPYDYDGTSEYPFLMLLHGAGERGTDGTYHLSGGFPYLFNDVTKSSFNNIVFAPQCPEDFKWVECDWTYGSYNLSATPQSKPLGAAMSVVNKAFSNFKIDRDRVYVSGLSMGGYGTWDTLMRYGDVFAAGVPLCGGGDPTQASRLLDIPIRAFHGTADNIVPSRASKLMYDAIVAAGGTKCSYTALGGYDHMIWDYVYQLQWVFDWLYQQKLSDR